MNWKPWGPPKKASRSRLAFPPHDRSLLLFTATKRLVTGGSNGSISVVRRYKAPRSTILYWASSIEVIESVPHLPYSVELHDSRVSAIIQELTVTKISLRHAYIHRDGKGWSQDVDIVIGASVVEGVQPDYPATLNDGKMMTTLGPYHNLLELPLSASGPVNLELEFFSGNIVKIVGMAVEVAVLGVPVFIENVTL